MLVRLVVLVARVARVEEGSPDLPTGGPQEAAQAQQDLQGDLPVRGLRELQGETYQESGHLLSSDAKRCVSLLWAAGRFIRTS